jgi:hypothetical protein
MKFLFSLILALCAFTAQAQTVVQRHICACDAAADPHGLCVPGNDANDGLTPATAKASFPIDWQIGNMGGGSNVLMCTGGGWDNFNPGILEPDNSSKASPITFGTYAPASGATGRPNLRVTGINQSGFVLGSYGAGGNWRGGLIFKGLRVYCSDPGATGTAFQINGRWRHIELDDMRLEGCYFGFNNNDGGNGVTSAEFITIKNSVIANNRGMGMLATAHDFVIRGNTLFGNNNTGVDPTFKHAIYIGADGGGNRISITDNLFQDNSVFNGACVGGNLTTHGKIDDILIARNTIKVSASAAGCYGISMSPGYGGRQEYHRRATVEDNVVVGVGNNYILVSMAVRPMIRNNRCVSTAAQLAQCVIVEGGDAEDDQASGARIFNNACDFRTASAGNCVAVRQGTGHYVAGNVALFSSAATGNTKCFDHTLPITNFLVFNWNHCVMGGTATYSQYFATLAEARGSNVGLNDSTGDPLFVATPSEGNGYSFATQAGSPLVNSSSTTYYSPRDVLGCGRDATPDKGPNERGATACGPLKAPTGFRQR